MFINLLEHGIITCLFCWQMSSEMREKAVECWEVWCCLWEASKTAAKVGKKAAQSEAGRRATGAAVKGACDGVRDDMMAR